MPAFQDNEGHAVTLATNLPTTYVWYSSALNAFVVNPTQPGNCGTLSFYFWLTDTNLISQYYLMTVTILNTPPDFSSPPSLQALTNPYPLHVFGLLSINLPTLTDAEGGSIAFYTWDTNV